MRVLCCPSSYTSTSNNAFAVLSSSHARNLIFMLQLGTEPHDVTTSPGAASTLHWLCSAALQPLFVVYFCVFHFVVLVDLDLVFALIRLPVSGDGSGGGDSGAGRGGRVGGGMGFSLRSARAALDALFASAKWIL